MSSLYIRWPTTGSGSLTFSDTNSIDLTKTGTTVTADLRLSASSADAGFINSVLTIETDGLQAQVPIANTSTTGVLTSTDWNTFNSKQAALTLGNLTGTNITVTGGTGAVVGSGAAISIPQSVATSATPTFSALTITNDVQAQNFIPNQSFISNLGAFSTVFGSAYVGNVKLLSSGNVITLEANNPSSYTLRLPDSYAGTTGMALIASGSGNTAFGTINLASTSIVTGTLAVGNGGTGLTGGTSGGIPYYSGASTLASSGALGAGQVVLGGGAGTTPTTLAGTTTTLLHGNAAGAATYSQVVNADISASAAIDYSKLATLATGSILLGNAGTPTATALSGGATVGATGVVALDNATIIAKVLTGYASGAGTVASTDTILQAIQKLNGNDALKQPLATLTTKGDIYVATGASTVVRQAIGANDTVLTADSAQTNGLKWATTLTNPMTTAGDIIVGGASGAPARLALGTNGQRYSSNGTTVVAAWGNVIAAKSADYTVTDTDGVGVVNMTTSNTDRVVTLPLAANNTDREITIKKVDSGTGTVTVDGNGSETIDGDLSKLLISQWEFCVVKSNGTSWFVTSYGANTIQTVSRLRSNGTSLTTGTTANIATSSLVIKSGDWELRGAFGVNPAASTVIANVGAAISATSGNLGSSDNLAVPTAGEVRSTLEGQTGADKEFVLTLPVTQVTVAAGSTATFYLAAAVDFSVSTAVGYGSITARRLKP